MGHSSPGDPQAEEAEFEMEESECLNQSSE